MSTCSCMLLLRVGGDSTPPPAPHLQCAAASGLLLAVHVHPHVHLMVEVCRHQETPHHQHHTYGVMLPVVCCVWCSGAVHGPHHTTSSTTPTVLCYQWYAVHGHTHPPVHHTTSITTPVVCCYQWYAVCGSVCSVGGVWHSVYA